jgi:N-acyl-phosphatidylethanolamine-hydrolysing phospholipase D
MARTGTATSAGREVYRARRAARLALALAAIALPCALPARTADAPGDVPEPARALYAPHGDSRTGFFTPWSEAPARTLSNLLRWQLFTRNPYDKSRDPVIPVTANDGHALAEYEPGTSFTWVGHATFAIHDGNDVILTDPVFGSRALLPARLSPPGVPLTSVPPDAFAVISHSHYDHLDAYTVDALPASVQWFVPLGLGDWFRERERPNVVELDWWQSAVRGRWTITCLPSQHWSRRLGMDENQSLWCAWLISSGERRYFFAGDSGYFPGFAEYGRRFGPIDVALLPIGAYEPRWFMKWQHMDPAEAVQAYRDLRARVMLGMHWGTFDLTDEPADLPPHELARLVAENHLDPERVRTLAIGEVWRAAEPR